MKNFNGVNLMGTLLSLLVLSGSAQANPQTNQAMPQLAPAKTNGQIAEQFSTENKVNTPANEAIPSVKQGDVRPEGNANPWAGGDSEEELRAFFGEKP